MSLSVVASVLASFFSLLFGTTNFMAVVTILDREVFI
jgi:hypothetical protein